MSKPVYNPARKGPVKVWTGYRNLRVPLELFDDVKNYLEKRKIEYLGGNTESKEKPPAYNNLEIDDLNRRIRDLENKLNMLLSSEIPKEKRISKNEPKLTSKERILLFLKEHPGERFSTVQLARILELPDATCRQSARELADSNPDLHQIPGRPNKYYYSKS